MDALRTVRVALTDIVPYAARLGVRRDVPTTTTEEGLALVRAWFGRTLDRLGIDLSLHHAGRVPREGGLVFLYNQESHLDHLFLPCAMPRPFFSFFGNDVARFPLYGAHLRKAGHVHVDRTDEAQWRASIARAAAVVRGGACVLLSPEGTRSWDGELLPMKKGAFILALAAARPIVCVTVAGAHERMPRGSPFVRPGKIHVAFSGPIAVEGETEARLRQIVVDTFQETKKRLRE